MLIWLAAALVGVLGFSFNDVYIKRLTRDLEATELTYLNHALASIFAVPVAVVVALSHDWGVLTLTVVFAALVSLVLNVLGNILIITSISKEDISIVAPLFNTNILYVAILEPIVLSTTVDPILAVSATIATVGAYILLVDGRLRDLKQVSAPLRRLTDTGPRLALGAGVVFAGVNLSDKIITSAVNPLVYTGFVTVSVSIVTFGLLHQRESRFATNPLDTLTLKFVPLGVLRAMGLFGFFTALSLGSATQTVVTLQLIPLITTFVGGFALGEPDTPRRLLGASLIVTGMVLLLV